MSDKNRLSQDNSSSEENPKYSKPQRIAALIGLVLIFGLAITTLVVAITDSTGQLFRSFLMLTIAAPILIWIYIWLYGKYRRRHTIASFDFMGSPDDEPVDASRAEMSGESASDVPAEMSGGSASDVPADMSQDQVCAGSDNTTGSAAGNSGK